MNNQILMRVVLAPIAMGVAICASAARPDETATAFVDSAQYCERTTKPSEMGYCIEREFTDRQPDWTSNRRAPYMAAFFSYINAAGERLESGEWDQSKYENEIRTFMNRMSIRAAEADRARAPVQNSAVESFVRGLNSGITCINYGTMIRCR